MNTAKGALVNCSNCQKEFEAVRSTSKYCSTKCRVYANREAQVTTSEVCPLCHCKKDAMYTQKEFLGAIDEVIRDKEAISRPVEIVKPQSVNVSGAVEPVISYE